MNGKRLKAIAKLLLLFGTPLALVLGLFSGGVYFGAEHRRDILEFERDWLRLDVEVPEAPTQGEGSGVVAPADTPAASPAPKPAPTPVQPTPAEPPKEPEPAPTPAPAPAMPVGDAEPLTGELAERLAMPLEVSAKVLVDPAFVEQHPDWIDQVQRSVASASLVYEKQFGIRLSLMGIGQWGIATDGMDAAELLADLQARPREGADILLGFSGRTPPEADAVPAIEAPDEDGTFNGAYGVVFASPQGQVRPMLAAVAAMLGATAVTDSDDPAYVAGSWMSTAAVPSGQAQWIDAENRRRVLEGKERRFRPEGQVEE